MFLICAGVHATSEAPGSQSYEEIISTLDKAMYDDDVLKAELDSLKGTISLDDLAGLRTASEATLTEADRGFVYSIRRKDQDEHHYILGTLHTEDKFYQLHLEEQLKKMVEREGIQTVYTEMDFRKEQNAKARFEQAMIAGLQENGFDNFEGLETMKTMSGHMLPGISVEDMEKLSSLGPVDHDTSPEGIMKIMEMIRGLNLDFQLPTFSKEQFSQLAEAGGEQAKVSDLILQYHVGDKRMMYFDSFVLPLIQSFSKNPDAWEQKNQAMFYGRNEDWLAKIGSFKDLHDSPCLITVGANHLYGSRGIVRLLRKAGWDVEHYGGIEWPSAKSLESFAK